MSSALCVSVEGIDGAGKTTFTDALVNALNTLNIFPLRIHEPGGTEVGEEIRRIVKSELHMDDWTKALLFAASRRSLVEEVLLPAKATGKWVVLDRFVDSMFVYQASPTVSLNDLGDLHAMTTGGFLPDCTFWLDTPPKVAMGRAISRGYGDPNDRAGIEHYERLAKGFLQRYTWDDDDRIFRLDGTQPLATLVRVALEHCQSLVDAPHLTLE
jgi:dTMP kinase